MNHKETATRISSVIGNRVAICDGQVGFGFALILLIMLATAVNQAQAFRVIHIDGRDIGRWNAAPHLVDGVERSLDGGIRYSITGGSWEAFHREIPWKGAPPAVQDLQATVEQAFAEWESVDPVTGLGTDLRFVPDFDTPVKWHEFNGESELNPGAEIDLVASDFGFGSSTPFNLHGDPIANSVALTSGVADYAATVASGADFGFNTNHAWDLDEIRGALSWGIPLMMGLQPADELEEGVLSRFYDDNYDGTNSETARSTLTNTFAALIDPFDPNHSPGLNQYDVCKPDNDPDFSCSGDPGISTPGVNLLTESTPEATAPGWKMQNDDFAGRQFLYPFVPTPGDFDADRSLTVQDIDLLSAEIRKEEPRYWFDLNGDKSINADDRVTWVELKHTYFGDSNLDGEFNSTDFVVVFSAGAYEDGISENSAWADGDWNGDGDFDSSDFVAAFNDGGYEKGPKPVANAVPEPSSLLLILISCVGFALNRSRQRDY